MRQSFNGLYGLVRDRLLCDPLSGHLFLFANAQKNRLKILFWDQSGLWVCAKRLERGRFHWPAGDSSASKIILSHAELALLLEVSNWLRHGPGDGIGRSAQRNPIRYETPHKHCTYFVARIAPSLLRISIVSETSHPGAASTPIPTQPSPADLLEQLKAQLPESLFATVSGAMPRMKASFSTHG